MGNKPLVHVDHRRARRVQRMLCTWQQRSGAATAWACAHASVCRSLGSGVPLTLLLARPAAHTACMRHCHAMDALQPFLVLFGCAELLTARGLPCRVSIVMEHFIRMLQACGLPAGDCDMIHGNGKVVNELLVQAQPRNTLFTGSGKIAEKLALDLKGKVGAVILPSSGS